jgi:hypothetical protein
MKWENEPWRKLYTRLQGPWLRLPLSARGLARELLAYADDRGLVVVLDGTEEHPGDAFSSMMGARPNEFARVRTDVDALVSDKYLVRKGNEIYIRNFVEAQTKRSAAATRMARKRRADRDQKQPEPAPPVATGSANSSRTVTPTVTSPSDATVTPLFASHVTDTRRDETKRSVSRTHAREEPPKPNPEPPKLELWDVIQRLADGSRGRIQLTALGSMDIHFQRLLNQLAEQGWTQSHFDTWATLAASGDDDWWRGEYTTGALLGRAEADGTRSGTALLWCLEEARKRMRQRDEAKLKPTMRVVRAEPQATPSELLATLRAGKVKHG